MQRFSKRLILFLFSFFLLLNFIVAPLIILSSSSFEFLPWSYIYARLIEIQKKPQSGFLIFGDSVASQLFPFKKGNYSFTTNGSVLLAGNYILLKEYLRTHPKPDTLLFVITPASLQTTFESPLVFNSFCKPFLALSFLPYLSGDVKTKLQSNIHYGLAFLPAYKVLGCVSDPVILPAARPDTSQFISPTNFEYLIKINELVAAEHIYCRFVSPAIARNSQNTSLDWDALKTDIQTAGAQSLFENYIPSIAFQDSMSFIDGTHFSKAYLFQNASAEKKRLLGFLHHSTE